MQPKRQVRVIKRDERERAEKSTPAATAEARVQSPERQLKTVVSSWVREHKERSEEYHRMFVALLKETGFRPSRA